MHRLTGFLLGSTLAGAGVYYYILEEYKVSNELLTEDIYVSLLYEKEKYADQSWTCREVIAMRKEDEDENRAN